MKDLIIADKKLKERVVRFVNIVWTVGMILTICCSLYLVFIGYDYLFDKYHFYVKQNYVRVDK
jgi:Trk-type K+ transport system membrane component